jgi:hypothetical protein
MPLRACALQRERQLTATGRGRIVAPWPSALTGMESVVRVSWVCRRRALTGL